MDGAPEQHHKLSCQGFSKIMNPYRETAQFEEQLTALKEVATESSRRLVSDPPDPLFESHANVFIKSYLVSACSILETFLQNEALYFVYEMRIRAENANIPHNLTRWSSGAKDSAANQKFASFKIDLDEKIVTEKLSGNIDKTILSFSKIGVDIASDQEFKDRKDFISARVFKRNAIIHDNDDASDISFGDITEVAEKFLFYCPCIKRMVRQSPHLSSDEPTS